MMMMMIATHLFLDHRHARDPVSGDLLSVGGRELRQRTIRGGEARARENDALGSDEPHVNVLVIAFVLIELADVSFSFAAVSKTSAYQIGICTTPDSSMPDAAIVQREKNETRVLGQLSQASLVTAGQSVRGVFLVRRARWFLFLDSWLLLTYENGTRDNITCPNKTRSATIIFICGQSSVRWKVHDPLSLHDS